MKFSLLFIMSFTLAGCITVPITPSPETITKPLSMCIDSLPTMPPLPIKPNTTGIKNDQEIIDQLLLEISKHRFYIYKRELALNQWLVDNLRRCQ